MALSSTVAFREIGVDRLRINGALRSARNKTMLTLIGNPRGDYDQECRWPTNTKILDQVATDDVGPFRVSGLRPALSTLRTILAEVKTENRDVFDALGHVGMLCCRFVRGSSSAISNHSWGTAIDLTLDGKLDRRGDDRAQRGLLAVYQIFNKHGFFWGSAFGIEDSMHFEASDQLIRQWARDGLIAGGLVAEENDLLDYGDRGPEVVDLQETLNLRLGLDLDVDGIFGPATRAAVMEFQRQNGLSIDGVVGPSTAKALGIALS